MERMLAVGGMIVGGFTGGGLLLEAVTARPEDQFNLFVFAAIVLALACTFAAIDRLLAPKQVRANART